MNLHSSYHSTKIFKEIGHEITCLKTGGKNINVLIFQYISNFLQYRIINILYNLLLIVTFSNYQTYTEKIAKRV